LVGDRDDVTRLDRLVHEQDDAGDQVAEGLLQAETDGQAESAGEHGKCGEIDAENVDTNKDRQRPNGERDQLL
jgi:hypothetical protein